MRESPNNVHDSCTEIFMEETTRKKINVGLQALSSGNERRLELMTYPVDSVG